MRLPNAPVWKLDVYDIPKSSQRRHLILAAIDSFSSTMSLMKHTVYLVDQRNNYLRNVLLAEDLGKQWSQMRKFQSTPWSTKDIDISDIHQIWALCLFQHIILCTLAFILFYVKHGGPTNRLIESWRSLRQWHCQSSHNREFQKAPSCGSNSERFI